MKINNEIIKLLKNNQNKELLLKVKGFYMPIEFGGLEFDSIVFKLRPDFEDNIEKINFEKEKIK